MMSAAWATPGGTEARPEAIPAFTVQREEGRDEPETLLLLVAPTLSASISGGVFVAGGPKVGPRVEFEGAWFQNWLPYRWLGGSLRNGGWLLARVGYRGSWLSRDTDVRGLVQSSLQALVPQVGARYILPIEAPLLVDLQAAVGPAFFRHSLTGRSLTPFSETGVRLALDAHVGVSYRTGAVEPFLRMGYGFASIETERLRARLGGFTMDMGVRYLHPRPSP